MNLYEFNDQFSRLCKRWGKRFNDEQAGIYIEFARSFDLNIFQTAVSGVMEVSRGFPTPSELRQAYYAMASNKSIQADIGCSNCVSGLIEFTRLINGFKYDCANPCANCQKRSLLPLIVAEGQDIFYAYRRTGEIDQFGNRVYKSDLKVMRQVENAYIERLGNCSTQGNHPKMIRDPVRLRELAELVGKDMNENRT